MTAHPTPNLRAITDDIARRLKARENGVRVHVDQDQSYASPATVYVFVSIDDAGGKSSLELLRMFETVEREANARFQSEMTTDILILPARPTVL